MLKPLTASDLDRAREAWADIQVIRNPGTQSMAVVFWACAWAPVLLQAAAAGVQPVWDGRAFPISASSHTATPGAREKGVSHPGTLAPGNLMTTGEDDALAGGRG